jgi:hypothetical protein
MVAVPDSELVGSVVGRSCLNTPAGLWFLPNTDLSMTATGLPCMTSFVPFLVAGRCSGA